MFMLLLLNYNLYVLSLLSKALHSHSHVIDDDYYLALLVLNPPRCVQLLCMWLTAIPELKIVVFKKCVCVQLYNYS